MKFIQFAIWVFIFLLFNSCTNQIDVIADYEENASVFALLDPNQPIQFVKINKVFTNPGVSAASVARIADSLFFDSLAPTLTELETGRIIPLLKTNTLLKDNGYFANFPNYLYSTVEKIYAHNPNNHLENYNYRLDIYLPSTHKHIWATTNIPDSTVFLSPGSLTVQKNREITFPLSGNINFSFLTPNYGKIFDAIFSFKYLEINKIDTNKKTIKVIDFKLINSFAPENGALNSGVNIPVNGSAFYDFLLKNINIDNTVIRKFLTCKVELTDANQQFLNYWQVSQPSIGIVQKQSEYSNVNNGFGLFA